MNSKPRPKGNSLVPSLRVLHEHFNRIADPEPPREATLLAEVWVSGNLVPPHSVLALAALMWGATRWLLGLGLKGKGYTPSQE